VNRDAIVAVDALAVLVEVALDSAVGIARADVRLGDDPSTMNNTAHRPLRLALVGRRSPRSMPPDMCGIGCPRLRAR
jgi:hypothetical protein